MARLSKGRTGVDPTASSFSWRRRLSAAPLFLIGPALRSRFELLWIQLFDNFYVENLNAFPIEEGGWMILKNHAEWRTAADRHRTSGQDYDSARPGMIIFRSITRVCRWEPGKRFSPILPVTPGGEARFECEFA